MTDYFEGGILIEKVTERLDKVAYTRKEAAEALSVSMPTLDKLARKQFNPLPCFHVGNKPLFPVAELHEWARREAETDGRII